jgi:hypothetical protein
MVADLALIGVDMPRKKKTADAEAPADTGNNGAAEPLVATPDENGFVGDLSEQAQIAIAAIQRQQVDIQGQLGQLTIREHQLVANMNNLQNQAKRILDSEAVRLGIPKGKPWQVTPEGKARLVG